MGLEYAIFILVLYVVLVLAGIWLYQYLEMRSNYQKAVPLPILNDREKRKKLNERIEPFGFAYDGKQNIYYSRIDSWQRNYGYGKIFDEGAALVNIIIDCEPIYFDYAGKKWLIEFWKGQYGVATGGEVGIYYLDKEKAVEDGLFHELHYRCVSDEDTLRIKTILWKEGRQLFYRKGYHWWLSGFVAGEFSRPKKLEMDIEITLKDAAMRDAFLQGLYEAGYQKGEVSVLETTVWVHFTKPHTPQPKTRTGFISFFKQWENKRWCRIYQNVTKDYANVYDKALALQTRAPELNGFLLGLSVNRHQTGGNADEPLS